MASPDLRLFLGKSGQGKTYLALFQARANRRLLIHDPNGEGEHAKGALVISDRAQLVQAIGASDFRICWRGALSARSMDDRVAAFEWANRCAWAAGNLGIVWDEVDTFTPGGRLPPMAYRIVNAGRHRSIRLYACARRVLRVPRDLSANATRIVAFRVVEPADIKQLRQVIGVAADRLFTLADRQAIDWTDEGARVRVSLFD